MNPKVSVILPVYNESQQISETLKTITDFLKSHQDYLFIFVDDGSTDNTKQIIEAKIKLLKSKQILLVSYPKNKGKGHAIKTGVKHSEGNFVIFTDGDLAYSLGYLETLVKNLNNHDLVIGSRPLIEKNKEKISPLRKLFGKSFNYIIRFILNLNFKDTQAGIKGFRKPIADNLFQKQSLGGWAFDVELIYIANKKGYSILEVPVEVSNNDKRKSRVNLISDSIKMFLDVLKIKINNLRGKYD